MYDRTPTPAIDHIWHRDTTIARWLLLWIEHLESVIDSQRSDGLWQPNRDDLNRYRQVADRYQHRQDYRTGFNQAVDEIERATRHDLVAVLRVFNLKAGADSAHLGLTSHDIVDVANQLAIADSLTHILTQTRRLALMLADAADQHRSLIIVGRTHGQPAQALPYGHRIATILSPLVDWYHRAYWWYGNMPTRPPYGAVGTGADLERAADAAGLDAIGYDTPAMDATRQTYHRSYDLHTAALLAELGSIAATWATDRRLEAITGLGSERRDPQQVGSSAMPHKVNPVTAERISSLVAVQRGYLTTAAELASAEWLEGDVSGSAGRRHWLHGIFRCTDQILTNWATAHDRWEVNPTAAGLEMVFYDAQVHTGAALHWLMQVGVPRHQAHELVAAAMQDSHGTRVGLADRLAGLIGQVGLELDLQAVEQSHKEWDLHLGFADQTITRVIRAARKLPAVN